MQVKVRLEWMLGWSRARIRFVDLSVLLRIE